MDGAIENKVLLIILDGWGLSPVKEGNAPLLAKTPILDHAYAAYPKMALAASGLEVGLNRGEMGNSEVGHLNIGSGRVVWESLPRIDQAIENGQFDKNARLVEFFKQAKEKRIHLIGLTSSGGVHSHVRHLYALLEAAKKQGAREVYIHFISDGRDTSVNEAEKTAIELQNKINQVGIGKVSTLIGRYYAMDRDRRWERTEKAYKLLTEGTGEKFENLNDAIKSNYEKKITDEFTLPAIIDPEGVIKANDAILFYNFRADRIKQLIEAIINPEFSGFKRDQIESLTVASITQYDDRYKIPVIFEPVDLKNCFADILESKGIKQYHTAETEKFPHVTYFFNGGNATIHQGEDQVIVPSPKVKTYDKMPEMSAKAVAGKVVSAMNASSPFILVNFANGDMVGHTGNLQAAIVACETIDGCLKTVLAVASQTGYKVLITADHGNCEMMIDPATKQPDTEHTTNPVPFVYIDFDNVRWEPEGGGLSEDDLLAYSSIPTAGVLSDISPTILSILNLSLPPEMIGTNLIEML